MDLQDLVKSRAKAIQDELAHVGDELNAMERQKNLLAQKKRELDIRLEELNILMGGQISKVVEPSKTEISLVGTKSEDFSHVAGSATKAALIEAINATPEKYATPAELSDELQKKGIKSGAHDFTHLVRTTLNALRKEGKVAYTQGPKNTVLYTSVNNPNLKKETQGGGTMENFEYKN